jgi:GT2 family glycosyltransferase
MNMPLVVAILLNWNNSKDTIACLGLLCSNTYPNLQIIVIDNGSHDDSVAQIQAAYPNVPIIKSPINRGFAGGVNQGLQYTLARHASYALLLNSDISFQPNLISELVTAAEHEPDAGVFGPKVYQNQATKQFSMAGFRLTAGGVRLLGWHASDHGQFDHTRIDAIAGCAMLIRNSTLRQVGLFDQHFFFYFEDIDYCVRVADAGLQVRLVPHVAIEHELGGSTRRNPTRRQFLLAANRVRFLRKHFHRFNPFLLLFNELRELANQLRTIIQLGPSAAIGYIVGLWVGFSKSM